MKRRCDECRKTYDDAEQVTYCPHELIMPRPDLEQKKAGLKLLMDRKRVRFAHDVEAKSPGWMNIMCIGWNGMVQLVGMPGEFAPHLFVQEEPECQTSPKSN